MSLKAAYIVPHPPIIIPAIGRGEEAKIRKTTDAYRQVAEEIAGFQPETIILTSPHMPLYQDYFHISPGKGGSGSFARFGAPGIRLKADYDTELIQNLSDLLSREDFPAGTLGGPEKEFDHATLVPLYFIQERCRSFRLVRIGLSGLSVADHYRLGRNIRRSADELGRNWIFVASGDLSHRLREDGPYGFAPEGPVYDDRIMTALGQGDFSALLTMDGSLCEAAGECGHRSFAILAGSLDKTQVKARTLSYEGPFGVGYGIVAFHPTGSDDSRDLLRQYEDSLLENTRETRQKASPQVRLALAVILAQLKHSPFDLEEYAKLEELPAELKERQAGVFVSLKRQGALRGCIGTIGPTTGSIAEEICRNAREAAFHDPRFAPLAEEEFADLDCSVDVLGLPEPVSSLEELDPKRYGVIVSKGRRRGLLLPDLEGVDTARRQVEIAKSKAGIAPEEEPSLERFEVVRYR